MIHKVQTAQSVNGLPGAHERRPSFPADMVLPHVEPSTVQVRFRSEHILFITQP